MRVRVIRSIKVKPERNLDFLRLSLKTADHLEAQTKIRPDVFRVRHAPDDADVKVFMDFDSLAQYEQLFLEGVLFDKTYLTLAERAVDMIREEPNDAMLVLMDKDDYFMNLKDGARKRECANPARGSTPPRRYRLSRHIDVPKGRLREFMKNTFDFMDRFEVVAKFRPELFCTRFTAERIGCSKVFFDFDECPQCDALLLQQEHELLARTANLVEGRLADELYVRVNESDLALDFGAGAAKAVPKAASVSKAKKG